MGMRPIGSIKPDLPGQLTGGGDFKDATVAAWRLPVASAPESPHIAVEMNS